MSTLYLWINILSLSVPLLVSFHPRLKLHKIWPALFAGIAIQMLVYIPWDIIFTYNGFWGFNKDYLIGISIFKLPIEEWLFFICIPYACVFTHYAMVELTNGFTLLRKQTLIITMIIMATLTILLFFNLGKWYTMVNFGYTLLMLYLTFKYKRKLLNTFYWTFPIMILPMLIVNGILTGSWIDEPVVWYSPYQFMGFRIGTIPFEDFFYAMGMMLTVLLVIERWPLFSSKK